MISANEIINTAQNKYYASDTVMSFPNYSDVYK